MKIGDLVKVSNRGFSAIGCITKICDSGYYIVHYFSQHGKDTHHKCTGGLWSYPYMTLLKEVTDEKEIGTT